ncbi:Pycsar system effector family protein [Microvirga solisilvae]|uniref:Pycsar system effector family protein n=1 Tax=Microvirga solisilvae TaxID=2919498 RepID=UPI001FAEF3A7|nr:Pycsar system effector family protein [Microvirga solisilvae]
MTASNIDRAEKNLQRLLEWVGRHDARSATVFGVVAAMIGAAAALLPPPSDWVWQLWASAIATAGGFSFVLVKLFQAQFPRLSSPNKSLIYFGTISRLTLKDYHNQFLQMSEEDYLRDLIAQCHINSAILETKFNCLKAALMCLLLTLAPWTTTIYLAKEMAS